MYDQSAHWVNEIRFFRIQDSRNRQQDIWRIFGRVCVDAVQTGTATAR